MSASDGSLLTTVSPTELLDRARGRSLTQIAVEGIGGYLLALSTSAIAGLQAVFDFLFAPVVLAVDVLEAGMTQLIIRPLGLTDFGLAVSAQALPQFGFLALPVSSAIALLSVLILIGFLALGITGNFGLVLDNPVVDVFTTTPEEEFDDED